MQALHDDAVRADIPILCEMGLDILPSELPREASQFFGDQLMPFLEDLSSSDGTKPYSKQDDLPPALRGAVIACNGRLTPDYAYVLRIISLKHYEYYENSTRTPNTGTSPNFERS